MSGVVASRPRLMGTVLALSAVVSLAGAVISVWVAASDGDSLLVAASSFLVVVSFVVVGSVVVSARPDNAVGWLLLGGGVAWAVGNAAIDLAYHGIVVAPGSVAGASAWALVGACIRDVGWWGMVLGLPAVFPTGHVLSRRWRWLPILTVVVCVCAVIETLTAADADLTQLDPWQNPLALPADLRFLNAIAFFGSLPLGLGVFVAAIRQLRERWRIGSALERQQLTIFTAAAIPPIVAAPLALLGVAPGVIFILSVIPLPFAIGYAVLAQGLYDVSTAVNRTLVWATLSVVVAAAYIVVIGVVGTVLDLSAAPWLPWVVAGLLAISFAPLRGIVQRAVDRLTWGKWAEPYAVLADLGQQLGATADVERLLSRVVEQLGELGLRGVGVSDNHGKLLAHSGSLEGELVQLPLLAYDRPVGVLAYQVPTMELRQRDVRLLHDVAAHLSGVLYGYLLTVDLQHARERLVLAREEERRRLRRDLHDGLGPALAGHLLRLDVIAARTAGSPVRADVDALRDDLRVTMLDVRRIVEGLRPPALDNLGLEGALRQATQRLTAGTVQLDLRVADLPPLPAAMEVAALNIVTEAVSNAVRHADATACCVSLDLIGGTLRIVVADDGKGLRRNDSSVDGHGLQTMRERAEELRGRLTVVEGQGVTVTAELPLAALPQAPTGALMVGFA